MMRDVSSTTFEKEECINFLLPNKYPFNKPEILTQGRKGTTLYNKDVKFCLYYRCDNVGTNSKYMLDVF